MQQPDHAASFARQTENKHPDEVMQLRCAQAALSISKDGVTLLRGRFCFHVRMYLGTDLQRLSCWLWTGRCACSVGAVCLTVTAGGAIPRHDRSSDGLRSRTKAFDFELSEHIHTILYKVSIAEQRPGPGEVTPGSADVC